MSKSNHIAKKHDAVDTTSAPWFLFQHMVRPKTEKSNTLSVKTADLKMLPVAPVYGNKFSSSATKQQAEAICISLFISQKFSLYWRESLK